MSAGDDDFFKIVAEIEKAEQKFEEAWARLVKKTGREAAERFALGKMGVTKAGRPDSNDEIDQQIRTKLLWSQLGGPKKIVPKEIADRILAAPPRKVTYRTEAGPDACTYIDSDTGELCCDPDAQIDSVPVEIKAQARSLETRVRRVMNAMIDAGELKAAHPASSWVTERDGVKSRTIGKG